MARPSRCFPVPTLAPSCPSNLCHCRQDCGIFLPGVLLWSHLPPPARLRKARVSDSSVGGARSGAGRPGAAATAAKVSVGPVLVSDIWEQLKKSVCIPQGQETASLPSSDRFVPGFPLKCKCGRAQPGPVKEPLPVGTALVRLCLPKPMPSCVPGGLTCAGLSELAP